VEIVLVDLEWPREVKHNVDTDLSEPYRRNVNNRELNHVWISFTVIIMQEVGGFKLPFIVMGSALIAAIPFLYFMLSNERGSSRDSDETEKPVSMLKALRIPGVFMLALCYMISGLQFGYIDPIFSLHMKQLGKNSTQIGLLFVLFSGMYAVSTPLVGWIGDKTKCYRWMHVLGFISFAVGSFLLGPAPFLSFLPAKKVWLVCVALAVCGVAEAFSYVPVVPDLLITATLNGMPDNSATIAVLSSIYGTFFYLGATIGPTIAGITEQHFGFQWATSIAGFICFGHAMLLSAFTMFEHLFQRNESNCGLYDEEGKPLLPNH